MAPDIEFEFADRDLTCDSCGEEIGKGTRHAVFAEPGGGRKTHHIHIQDNIGYFCGSDEQAVKVDRHGKDIV